MTGCHFGFPQTLAEAQLSCADDPTPQAIMLRRMRRISIIGLPDFNRQVSMLSGLQTVAYLTEIRKLCRSQN